jgi:hypothetical protein
MAGSSLAGGGNPSSPACGLDSQIRQTGNEIQAHLQTRQIFYWRDKLGHEVDFIFRNRPAEPTAIECTWSPGDFDPVNLGIFIKHYPLGKNLVVAQDVERPYEREYKGLRVKMVGVKDLVRLLKMCRVTGP